MVDTTGMIQLKAEDAAHPLFEGIALDGNGVTGDYAGIITYSDVVQRGVSVNNDALSAGGTLLATVATADDPTFGGPIAAEWDAGGTSSTGQVLGGKRMILLTGSRELDFTSHIAGIYDLTSRVRSPVTQCGKLSNWFACRLGCFAYRGWCLQGERYHRG